MTQLLNFTHLDVKLQWPGLRGWIILQTISDSSEINLSTVYFILPWDSGHTWSFDAFQDKNIFTAVHCKAIFRLVPLLYSFRRQQKKLKHFYIVKSVHRIRQLFTLFSFIYSKWLMTNVMSSDGWTIFHHYSPKENEILSCTFLPLSFFRSGKLSESFSKVFLFYSYPIYFCTILILSKEVVKFYRRQAFTTGAMHW